MFIVSLCAILFILIKELSLSYICESNCATLFDICLNSDHQVESSLFLQPGYEEFLKCTNEKSSCLRKCCFQKCKIDINKCYDSTREWKSGIYDKCIRPYTVLCILNCNISNGNQNSKYR